MKSWIQLPKEKLIEKLWAAEPKIKSILQNSKHVEEARFIIFDYLNRLERDLFNMRSDTYFCKSQYHRKEECQGMHPRSFQCYAD